MTYTPYSRGRQGLSASSCSCRNDNLEEDVASLRALSSHIRQKKALMQTVLKSADSDNNDECIRLRREWDMTKRALQAAYKRVKDAANKVKAAQREFSRDMDGDISVAYASLLKDVVGAILSRSPTSLVGAVVSFESWRRLYQRKLPATLARHLGGVWAEYKAAAELVRDETENERKITERMSRLRCANFN